ncbi:hypothetical protein [Natrarchaeobius chitinivorans]|uniref:Uncharacterized protein n=1 Tax=Natrarchaeobius chitinivorans TaxID=1679083 RepID=A0A3N6LQF0_NATCH|nr:hypothetical protein [Natrarchaeobius chitinivorans]RQG91833.1 hypothetical protein EA473_18765 [Natrarchaeobius chitinivorans]
MDDNGQTADDESTSDRTAIALFAVFGLIIFVHGVITGEIYRILMGSLFGTIAVGVFISPTFEQWATDHALAILAALIFVFFTSLLWQGS